MSEQENQVWEAVERQEWLESLDYVIKQGGKEKVRTLMRALQNRAAKAGILLPYAANTPYLNTISRRDQPQYPGTEEIERHIRSLVRWNAMAMVVGANRRADGIGGHIATYASCATLLEVGFNHFFRGKDHADGGDLVYFQGHAAPGIYSRAFLEGRLSEQQLNNFRRELAEGGGLSSYPHPYLMPNFWEFPTVSMGLSPIMAIYQARFNRYLEDRGLVKKSGKVWAFIGDGETDEPETLGAIDLASREKLENLIFVINCNLQRLDGPVRGNGKIIQELEAVFRGAGWNVIKVIWGSNWDPLLEKDTSGELIARMDEAVDGDYQKYSASDGGYIRKHFFGKSKVLLKLVEHLSDHELKKLIRGGHDPKKVYAAYKSAVDYPGRPSVILAKTVKGYGMGEAGEGRNITHQQKKMSEADLRNFRSRFSVPISDAQASEAPFFKPELESIDLKYLTKKREELGGPLPHRIADKAPALQPPDETFYQEFLGGSTERKLSTTMVVVRILANLLKDKNIGKHIVPIVPDEARTFGMETLFRQVGIYSHVGQKYEPVDRDTLLYYKESVDGQILEEGITEAGSISSFIAAGSAYASHGTNMIPFFLFYSMFGFQRIGDFLWASGDMGCRGFLIGGTAGKTTLAGEGLQHQDGHSLLLANPYPHIHSYDPAFAFEIATIIERGLHNILVKQKNIIYYLTAGNENYAMWASPTIADLKERIIKGIYPLQKSVLKKPQACLDIWGSGAIMIEAIQAAKILEEDFSIQVDIWSVTSYNQLYRNLLATQHSNLHSDKKTNKKCYLEESIENESRADAILAVSDNVRSLPYSVLPAIRKEFFALGTDGFGKSETRQELRNYFCVNADYIVLAALKTLVSIEKIDEKYVKDFMKKKSRFFKDKKNPFEMIWQ